MKYITIKLTEDQAKYLMEILSYGEGWVQNNELPKSDPQNAFIERIRSKLYLALVNMPLHPAYNPQKDRWES